jgi:hypothetical protein
MVTGGVGILSLNELVAAMIKTRATVGKAVFYDVVPGTSALLLVQPGKE